VARVLVFTATYEEAQNIPRWVGGAREAVPDAQLLVVDDDSPDGTGRILDALAADDEDLTVVHRPGKSGLASAHLLAMNYALEHEFDLLVTMDADGSHLPAQIPRLIAASGDSDFVIGTRYRGGSHRAGLLRRTLSAGANGLARIVLPTGLSEYTTSFRAFDRRSLDVLVAADFTTGGYAFFVECIEILHRAGVSMSEVPIDFVDRTHGSSKIPKSQIFMSVEALISMGIRRRKMPSM
jgi:dolichol-phosphate mannosyltransferase